MAKPVWRWWIIKAKWPLSPRPPPPPTLYLADVNPHKIATQYLFNCNKFLITILPVALRPDYYLKDVPLAIPRTHLPPASILIPQIDSGKLFKAARNIVNANNNGNSARDGLNGASFASFPEHKGLRFITLCIWYLVRWLHTVVCYVIITG